MRTREKVEAWRGEVLLSYLWVIRWLCKLIGLNSFYRNIIGYLVKRTGLFDRNYYFEHNGDVAEKDISPLKHYVAYGDKEGRHPMALFDPVYYRAKAKSRVARVNSLLHYAYIGRYKKISPSPWFDVEYYLANNKDIARAHIDPLLHYLKWGGFEGRSPCLQFDGAYYLRQYPDVSECRINPLIHYLYIGRIEGRSTTPEYGNNIEEVENYEPLSLPIPDESAWQLLTKRADIADAIVDVIVPVYKGRTETLRCLYSVLVATCQTPYELIVINDASPDKELTADLERLANQQLFTLEVNQVNRGFVHTVNKGMQLHQTRHIVLLNSDTEVYDGWLDRLSHAAHRNPKTGTVTPMSNNATICSYPNFLHDNPYPLELSYAELDGLAAGINKNIEVEAPTGVGFCMYIKRTCLDAVGLFDEKAFGKGYGEENDFCQKAIQKNWRNIIIADVFVRHLGAASFQGEKAKRVQDALKTIDKRYPHYRKQVDEFIKQDLLLDARSRLDVARLQRMSRDQNVLMVCHSRGGGSERRMQEDIQAFTNQGYGVFTLRPVAKKHSQVILGHPAVKAFPNINPFILCELNKLTESLKLLNIKEIYTHSLVDFEPEAPYYISQLVKALNAKWDINLHDYKVICPRINLADENGKYCGEPKEDQCNQCLVERGSDFNVFNIQEWRNRHLNALLTADTIHVPDEDVAERLNRYFPEVSFQISPHEQLKLPEQGLLKPQLDIEERMRIVVIGAIGKLKGFNVIIAAAKHARQNNLPIDFILMGYSMNDKLMEDAGVCVTGKYQENEGLEKLLALNPHVVWLPSLWPETYSYTLSLALKAHLQVFAFDIGAIARRAKEIGMDELMMPLAWADDPAKINQQFQHFREACLPNN